MAVTTATLAVRLMAIDAVAQALGISCYSVRRLISNGELRSVRVGGRVLVASDVVERVQRDGVGPRARKAATV